MARKKRTELDRVLARARDRRYGPRATNEWRPTEEEVEESEHFQRIDGKVYPKFNLEGRKEYKRKQVESMAAASASTSTFAAIQQTALPDAATNGDADFGENLEDEDSSGYDSLFDEAPAEKDMLNIDHEAGMDTKAPSPSNSEPLFVKPIAKAPQTSKGKKKAASKAAPAEGKDGKDVDVKIKAKPGAPKAKEILTGKAMEHALIEAVQDAKRQGKAKQTGQTTGQSSPQGKTKTGVTEGQAVKTQRSKTEGRGKQETAGMKRRAGDEGVPTATETSTTKPAPPKKQKRQQRPSREERED